MMSTYVFLAKKNKSDNPYYLHSSHTDAETAKNILKVYKSHYPDFEIIMIDFPDELESSPQKIIEM